MRHYFDAVLHPDTGSALEGILVRVFDADDALVDIYADENSTAIETVSGVDNAAATDEDGMFSLYVTEGTYTLRFYQGDTVIKTIRNVDMDVQVQRTELADTGGAALVGTSDGSTVQAGLDRRAVASSRSALADLSAIAGYTATLTEPDREGLFVFDDSDLSTEVALDTKQGVYVAPASDDTGASGAWVRKIERAVNVKWFGATGDGVTNDYAALEAARAVAADLGVGYHLPAGTYFIGTNELVFSDIGMEITGAKDSEIKGNGGTDGGYVVTFGSAGGTSQPATTHPTNQRVVGLRVRTVAPFSVASGRAAVRVCGSYGIFIDCSIATNADDGANGLRLEADNTGSGPYYNTFIDCNLQGRQLGTATGTGIAMRQRPGTTVTTRYPNTNVFIGGRVGGYLVNVEIAGNGNRFLGMANENFPSYGTAFKWSAPVAASNTGNAVYGPYIENCATAFAVEASCVNPSLTDPYVTGHTTMLSDPSNRLTVLGYDGLRGMRLAKTPNASLARSGIFVGNADNTDADTLDWYQEGTWTPTLAGITTPGSYTLSLLDNSYTRIGNKVFLTAQMTVTVNSAGTGAVVVSGLPFPKGANRIINGAVSTSGVTLDAATKFIAAQHATTGSDSTFVIRQVRSGTTALNLDCSALATGNVITVTLAYTV